MLTMPLKLSDVSSFQSIPKKKGSVPSAAQKLVVVWEDANIKNFSVVGSFKSSDLTLFESIPKVNESVLMA